MFVLVLAFGVLVVSSLPWVAISRPPNKPAWLAAFYLVGSADIVLTLCIANSFYLLNQRIAVLIIHLLIGGLGWLIWQRIGRPSLWGTFQGWKIKFDFEWVRSEPVLTFLFAGITLSYIFALVQLIVIPQNNVDGLSTHLARIVFWRQHGSIFPWPTFLPNQVVYPINAQLETYWTLLFLNSDRLVGVVQWLAALVAGLGVFGTARLFEFNLRQSAFSAMIFLSFPLVALQSTTTQTDLITTALFVLAIYFLILGLKDSRDPLLFLSAVSVGLGIGVKKSYLILLPILAVIALLAVLQFGKGAWKQIIRWSFYLMIGITFLGAYDYVVNWHYFGDPFGSTAYLQMLIDAPQKSNQAVPAVTATPSVADQSIPIATPVVSPLIDQDNPSPVPEPNNSSFGQRVILEIVYNLPRLFYQSLDTSGLPDPLDGYVHKVKMRVARSLFQWIGFTQIEGDAFTAPGHVFSLADKNINEESNAWYGPLSVLLIFPALLLQAWRGFRQRTWLPLAPAVAFVIFLPLEIVFRPGWDPYQGRYFAPLVALGASSMAIWFKEKGSAVHEWLIGSLAIVILTTTLLYNPSKPTLGKFADEFHIWTNHNHIFLQTIQRKNDRNLYYLVEKFVPANATFGYYIPFFVLDYPFFGEKLERRLVPIVVPGQVSDFQWLRAQGIDYLVLPTGDKYPMPPTEYKLIFQTGKWIGFGYAQSP